MRFRREEIEIEGGRKLYRYVFDEETQGEDVTDRDNREVPSDATTPRGEPKEEQTQ